MVDLNQETILPLLENPNSYIKFLLKGYDEVLYGVLMALKHSDFLGISTHVKKEEPEAIPRKRLVFLLLSILVFCASASLISWVWAPTSDPESPLDTDITFRVFPNGDFEMRVNGTLEEGYDYYQTASPLREMQFSFLGEPIEEDLYRESGSIVFKLGPQLALFLASLDLDIDMHAERLNSETTIQLGVPGMLGLEMSVESVSQEETSVGSVDVEATATIWYSIIPEETINVYVLGFPLIRAELESQIYDYSDGNLELTELEIIDIELGEVSATMTVKITVEGDFGAGITAIAENYSPDYLYPEEPPSFPESWMTTAVRSGDVHITFDSEDLAFNVEYEALLEGDIDEQVNSLKDLLLEDFLEGSDLDPDVTRLIYTLILPTEVSIVNLRITFNAILDTEHPAIEFDIDRFVLKPPSPEALLSYLGEASEGVEGDKVTLILEGVSQENQYVEIQVPDETTEPLSMEPQKVVWAFSDLENLDKVTFDIKETSSSTTFTNLLLPAIGVAAVAGMAIWYSMSRRS